MKKLILVLISSWIITATPVLSSGLTMQTGILDYSDDYRRSGFVEATYTFLSSDKKNLFGKFTPVTGAMITQDNATMIYTGIKGNFLIGKFIIIPSFTPGYYDKGSGKDLGSFFEFKSQINLGWNFKDHSNVGLSYSHISNGNLGKKNPGANNIAFTLFRQF